LEKWQLAIDPHKKPDVPGEGKENLACRKAALLDHRRTELTTTLRATGLQSADEIKQLIEVSTRTSMSRPCLTTEYPSDPNRKMMDP
jgi:hypothetical protein